jgi:hypothetical protein
VTRPQAQPRQTGRQTGRVRGFGSFCHLVDGESAYHRLHAVGSKHEQRLRLHAKCDVIEVLNHVSNTDCRDLIVDRPAPQLPPSNSRRMCQRGAKFGSRCDFPASAVGLVHVCTRVFQDDEQPALECCSNLEHVLRHKSSTTAPSDHASHLWHRVIAAVAGVCLIRRSQAPLPRERGPRK